MLTVGFFTELGDPFKITLPLAFFLTVQALPFSFL